MKAMLTGRKVSISIEQAKKDKLVELAPGGEVGAEFARANGTTYKSHLFSQGWKLTDDAGYIYKIVNMPLLVETPHASGGVPSVGTPTDSDVIDGINALMVDFKIEPTVIAEILNNGLYLAYNAANKPKSTVTQADMMSLFAKKSAPADHAAYFAEASKGASEGLAWLKAWYGKNA